MAWANVTFDEVLDDLSSRFIINVPDEELASVERICFQIEQAHWYYEDFVREQSPSFPSFNLKNFSAKFFQHCPLLHEWSNEHETAFANFMEYKIRVPVCGAIILNEAMDKCILVKGWTARSGWGFPKGKINKDEPDTLCAVREVWEETGFDVTGKIREEDYVEQTIKDQRIRLYIVKGVPETTVFEPQTRKEISKIEWHFIAELPTSKPKPIERGTQSGRESGTERPNGAKNPSRYYMVTPFVHKLKSWINAQRRNTKRNNKGQYGQAPQQPAENHTVTATREQQHLQIQAAAPVVSSTEARLDSEVLKSMLGIGKGPSSLQDPALAQQQSSPTQEFSSPQKDTRNSTESLKALLGIQSPVSSSMFIRDGMATGSPTIQSTSAQYPSARPVSTPSSLSSTTSYQNGSDALKAMLGIPTQSGSPLLHFSPVANGTPPVASGAGAIANGYGMPRPGFSPQIHHSSMNSSPTRARNGSDDLLAVLKGNGGGGAGNAGAVNGTGFAGINPMSVNSNGDDQNKQNRGANVAGGNGSNDANGHVGNGAPAKAPRMQNFAFDVDALF